MSRFLEPEQRTLAWVRNQVGTGLRDARAFFSQRLFWGLIAMGVMVTALAGPYGTFEYLTLAERLVYWGVSILVPALVATTLSLIALRFSEAVGIPWIVSALLAGGLTVGPALGVVIVLEDVLAGPPGTTAPKSVSQLFPLVAGPVLGVTVIVNAILVRFQAGVRAGRPEGATPASRQDAPDLARPGAAGPVQPPRLVSSRVDGALPLLLQRLPPELGRDVVCVQAQNHYLEVTTKQGKALVLMRLGDAERDLSVIDGLRVHRSWWVALGHVASYSRTEGGGASLTTSTGQVIPVARNQREDLIAALARLRSAAE